MTALTCACLETHAGPAGAFGCGAEWLLRVRYAPDGRSTSVEKEHVPNDKSYRYWAAADAAGAAVPASLATAQAAAGKWQAALTAIVGLVSVGALLTGRDTLHELSRSSIVELCLALGLALLATGVMLGVSDLASIGYPSMGPTPTVGELEDADLLPLQQAARALRRLRWALGAAVVAVAASIAVVGIVLFARPAPAATPAATFRITQRVGAITTTTGCGALTYPTPSSAQPLPTTVTFTPVGGTAAPIPLDEIRSVAAC